VPARGNLKPGLTVSCSAKDMAFSCRNSSSSEYEGPDPGSLQMPSSLVVGKAESFPRSAVQLYAIGERVYLIQDAVRTAKVNQLIHSAAVCAAKRSLRVAASPYSSTS